MEPTSIDNIHFSNILLLIAIPILIYTDPSHLNIATATILSIALILFQKNQELINKKGSRRKDKILQNNIEKIIEIFTLSSTLLLIQNSLYISLISFTLLILLISNQNMIKNQLNLSFQQRFRLQERTILLIIALISYSINNYLAFYILLLYVAILVYENIQLILKAGNSRLKQTSNWI